MTDRDPLPVRAPAPEVEKSMSRRVLVCGGRDYADEAGGFAFLDAEHALCEFALVIQGGARGADAIASRWAFLRRVPCDTYRADWSTHRRAAGPLRNARMIAEGQPTCVIAFPGGDGTADMVRRARAADIRVIEVRR